MVLDEVRGLVSRAGLLAPDWRLHELHLAKCSLGDCLTLIGLDRVLTSEQAEAGLRIAEVCQLEVRVCAAEEDYKALCVGRNIVEELVAERTSLTAGTEQAITERETLAARIQELEVAAATRNEAFGVVVSALQSLKGLKYRVAAGEGRANKAKNQASETLIKMSELWTLVEVLSQKVGDECGGVAGLFGANLVRVW